MESKVTVKRIEDLRNAGPRDLREGVTTGTCAAAACASAAGLLLSETEAGRKFGSVREKQENPEMPSNDQVQIQTPSGKAVDLEIVRKERMSGGMIRCTVIKDAGDDPDVTNGAEICAEVSWVKNDEIVTPEEYFSEDGERNSWEEAPHRIFGYMLPEFPGCAVAGGDGVGICTKKGLPNPVGFPAINPVPRRMILQEAYRARQLWEKRAQDNESDVRPEDAEKAAETNSDSRVLLVRISIPEGRALAEKTFNPKLGIIGGISVLGTTGVVHPMSEDSLIRTVELEVSVRAAEGRSVLAIAPGNYGKQYLHDRTGLDMDHFVKCSNYVGEAFRELKKAGVRKALFAGHPGKLIKVAGGILNTHSRYGDHRMEILSDCAKRAGAPESAQKAILGFNTTNEASDYLEKIDMLHATYLEAAKRVKKELEKISGAKVEVMFLDGTRGLLAQTDGAEDLIRILTEEEKKIYG